jgi:hypothetical protein
MKIKRFFKRLEFLYNASDDDCGCDTNFLCNSSRPYPETEAIRELRLKLEETEVRCKGAYKSYDTAMSKNIELQEEIRRLTNELRVKNENS